MDERRGMDSKKESGNCTVSVIYADTSACQLYCKEPEIIIKQAKSQKQMFI